MRHYVILVMAVVVALCASSPAEATTLEQQLFYAAKQQPRPWYPPGSEAAGARETLAEYEHRLGLATQVIARVTLREDSQGRPRTWPVDWRYGRRAIAASVLTHWYEESRFALEVHAGWEHPVWTQDVGKATCMGQLHVGLVPEREWATLAGVDEASTERCAVWTARALTRMANYCGGKETELHRVLLGMFSGLGGRGCATSKSARDKVERFGKIWKAMGRAPEPTNDNALLLPAVAPHSRSCYHLDQRWALLPSPSCGSPLARGPLPG